MRARKRRLSTDFIQQNADVVSVVIAQGNRIETEKKKGKYETIYNIQMIQVAQRLWCKSSS